MRGTAAGSGQNSHADFRHWRRGQGVQQHIRCHWQNHQAGGTARTLQRPERGDYAPGDVHHHQVGRLYVTQ